MTKEVDDMIVTAHMTMDTEIAAGDVIHKIVALVKAANASGDTAKVVALTAELEQRRLILAQAIANADATMPPPVVDPALTTTVDPNATTMAPETTAAPDTTVDPNAPTTTEAGIAIDRAVVMERRALGMDAVHGTVPNADAPPERAYSSEQAINIVKKLDVTLGLRLRQFTADTLAARRDRRFAG